MEASAIPASVGLARTRLAIGASLLRIRTDDQLVSLFREGNDEAFRVIHDRYRSRMFAYARQMLGTSGEDPEDAVQEIFMRAYHGLRANHRPLALRAWLYRIAHNRCIDDLRRPQPLAIDARDSLSAGSQDPMTKVEQRDALRRLISDVQRLPDQQRSALLMRELSGMSYAEVSCALGVSVPAVKSLLVRARLGLAQASEARNAACSEIRADLILAKSRGVRSSGLARRHLRECRGCREFRSEVRGANRQLAALAPSLGPIGFIANLLGWGGGGAATTGGGAMASSGAAVAGGSAATASGSLAAGTASVGLLAGGAGHVATLLAAAVVTAGGAVEIHNTLTAAVSHHTHRSALVAHASRASGPGTAAADLDGAAPVVPGAASLAGPSGASPSSAAAAVAIAGAGAATGRRHGVRATPITMLLDPDMYSPPNLPPAVTPPATSPPSTTGGATAPTSPGSAPAGATGSTSADGTSAAGTPPSTSGSITQTAGAPASGYSSGSSTGSDTSSAAAGSGSSSASGSTAPANTPATSSSTGNPSSTPSASSQTKNTSPTSSTSVGQSTSSAGARKVVSFIQHRRPRHRRMLDTLVVR